MVKFAVPRRVANIYWGIVMLGVSALIIGIGIEKPGEFIEGWIIAIGLIVWAIYLFVKAGQNN